MEVRGSSPWMARSVEDEIWGWRAKGRGERHDQFQVLMRKPRARRRTVSARGVDPTDVAVEVLAAAATTSARAAAPPPMAADSLAPARGVLSDEAETAASVD